MYLIAEMAAMIILSLINTWQRRDRQLPKGGKVRRLKGLPVVGFGWFKRNSVTGIAGSRHTAAITPVTEPVWTPPVETKEDT